MKARILSFAIVLTVSLGALSAVYTDSATWNANPVDNDWSNPANWTPATVPNGPNDVATFGVSSTTDVSITASIEVNSIVFSPGASAFTITLPASSGTMALTISGAGITNGSGITQNFVTSSDEDSGSFILFTGSATAGSGTLLTCNENSLIRGTSRIEFHDNTSAEDATVVSNGGGIYFFDDATAADATVIANGSDGLFPASAIYMSSANAGNATLIANDGAAYGGFILIGGADFNTARVKVYGNGHVTTGYGSDSILGSIEGDGDIILALDQNLSVGNNNLSTVFSGVIQDDPFPPSSESSSVAGQMQPASGGALTKTGTGTLTLNGPNRYTGTTTVTAGILKVGNKTRSGTGRRAVNVKAGTLGGKGVIAGITTIGTGIGAGSFLAPSAGANRPVTLTFKRALICKGDATYIYKLDTANATDDQVIAKGVTIENDAQFDFQEVANKRLTIGAVFIAIDNTSVNPISGTFANLPDGSTFSVGRNNYQVSYQGGDGNDLTLTVVP